MSGVHRRAAIYLALAFAVVISPAVGAAQERGRGDERGHREQFQRDEGRRDGFRPEARRDQNIARGDRGGHWWREGDIRHFDRGHDFDAWRGGHWEHARRDGRDGWWWIVGPDWYFYPAPVYPYPNPYIPPTVTTAPPPPTQAAPPALYYCPSAGGYYPYIPSCPEGWVQTAPQG